jgi:hypothetical protein
MVDWEGYGRTTMLDPICNTICVGIAKSVSQNIWSLGGEWKQNSGIRCRNCNTNMITFTSIRFLCACVHARAFLRGTG